MLPHASNEQDQTVQGKYKQVATDYRSCPYHPTIKIEWRWYGGMGAKTKWNKVWSGIGIWV